MFDRIARATMPLVAIALLVFGSGIAPMHAHESDSPDSPAVVHSHLEPHHLEDHYGDAPEIDHGEHIVWLDVAVVHALPFQLSAPPAVLVAVHEPVPCARCWSAIVFDEAAPPHGPPRPFASLRAPPARPA